MRDHRFTYEELLDKIDKLEGELVQLRSSKKQDDANSSLSNRTYDINNSPKSEFDLENNIIAKNILNSLCIIQRETDSYSGSYTYKIIDFNSAFETNFNTENYATKEFSKILCFFDDKLTLKLDQLYNSNDFFQTEHYCKEKNIFIDISAYFLKVNYILLVINDISLRKRAEKEILYEKEKLRVLIDNIPDNVYFKDRESRFVLINKAMMSYFEKKSYGEVIGKRDFDFFSDEHANQAYNDEQSIVQTGIPLLSLLEKETWHQKDETYVLTSKIPIFDAIGNVTGIIGISRNITEQVRSDMALKESEMNFRRLFDTLPLGMYRMTPDGNFLMANKTLLKYLGFESFEDLQASVKEVYKKGLYNRKKYISIIYREGVVTGFESKVCRKDGKIIDVVENAVLVKNETDNVYFFEGTLEDITERKLVEQELIENESRLQTLFDSSPIFIWEEDFSGIRNKFNELLSGNVTDLRAYLDDYPDMIIEFAHLIKIIDVNTKGLNFLKIQSKKMILSSLGSYMSEVSLHALKEEMIALWEGHTEFQCEMPLVIDDDYKVFVLHLKIVPGHETTLGRAIVSFIDITYMKETEQALSFEISVNACLADLSRELLQKDLSIEKISQKVYANVTKLTASRFACISNFTCDATASHFPNTQYLSPDERFVCFMNTKKNNSNSDLFIESPEVYVSYFENSPKKEWLICDYDGNIHKVQNYISVPAFADSLLVGQIIIANKHGDYNDRDLTIAEKFANLYALAIVRKQLQDDLIASKHRAEESDRLKSAFLANMSHEVRTPLNGIVGFSELLRKPNLEEEKLNTYIDVINSSCSQLLTIIMDIIEISKIESKQVKVHETKFNLNTLIQEVYTHFIEQAREKEIQLIIEPGFENKDAGIISDEHKCRQVLINLIGNALKFTHDGSITLKYSYNIYPGLLQFEIKDTGIGIAVDHQLIIFERFRQVDGSKTRKYGGTGLGLSISSAYIEMLGGKIWLESEIGKGSTFYFTLPYKKEDQIPYEFNFQNLGDDFDWKEKTILIVEDENSIYHYLEEAINLTNANLIRAKNGEEALVYASASQRPHLILMDIKMPVMNGIEATKKIREFDEEIIIIAQSALADQEDIKAAIEAGCNDFIEKPIDRKKLLKILNIFLKENYV